MFTIGIRYLSGVSVSAHPTDRTSPEWPPHPGRVFMALVAAHYAGVVSEDGRNALLWLEQQAPAYIAATKAEHRDAVEHYVPVNDVSSGIQLLPEKRPKRSRQFPAVVPHSDTVHMIWQCDPSIEIRAALFDICGKVTYIGHSSSLVQVWVEDGPVEPTLVPVSDALSQVRLRVPGPGTLSLLESRYKAGQRPASLRWVGYGSVPEKMDEDVPRTVFDQDLIILRKVAGEQDRPRGDGALMPFDERYHHVKMLGTAAP